MSWLSKKHHLQDMNIRELTVSYIQYPAIIAYALIAITGLLLLSMNNAFSWSLLAPVVLIAALYPLIWYLLHRYVLHSRFLYRFKGFAKVWKRIHYDHHRDPNDLRILFGALYTTLPTVLAFSIPLGYVFAGFYGAVACTVSGILVTMFYEYCHCIQHLHYTPKSQFLRDMKRLHLLHHFRNEKGNYGITNFFWDRVFKTYYDKGSNVDKSETVFNLGYTDSEISQYPWVAQLSEAQEER
ncbi:sterol desaturase family protein [Gammaproteobacteria bacterium]|jgi:sterol desaturase/sphingolipid hydroxylase (fatty acid hydroxylase superfamily)|nr:sterol desaturase family protein [Gammaproteobacteria bacterium]